MTRDFKVGAVDLLLIGVCVGYTTQQRGRFWLSWRRVQRELRRLKVGEV